MRCVAIIPARFASTRFPGKMMAKLVGKPVIEWTYQNAVKTGLFDQVLVATDSKLIFNHIENIGGNAIMTSKYHQTGSDRIAEAASHIDVDFIVNIQGDEPFIKKEPLEKLINCFKSSDVEIASLMQELNNQKHINDPNFVKVVVDKNDFVMYFSRAPIPFIRDDKANIKHYEHIGVYGFRKNALLEFSRMEQTELEDAEKIEPIRLLENGYKIKMVTTEYMGIEIDTKEDLAKAEGYILNHEI